MARILRILRPPGGGTVPGSALSRAGVVSVLEAMRRDKLADVTMHATVSAMLEAWTWAADDPATYPGIAPAPRDRRSLMPQRPVYAAAPAPTMAEADAVLVRLAALAHQRVALPLAVIQRCTGLRASQALALRWSDLVLDARVPSLTVRVGKSRRERVEQRTVPLAPVLAEWLLAREPGEGSDPVIRRRSDNAGVHRGGAHDSLAAAWKAAVAKGEVRAEVVAPEGRAIARPGHAFRAAFQAHLVAAGVRDEVIDVLVGHTGGLRERHYVGADSRWSAMVAAVATIPPLPALS